MEKISSVKVKKKKMVPLLGDLGWEKSIYSLLLLDFFLSRWEMSSNQRAFLCFPEKTMKFTKNMTTALSY